MFVTLLVILFTESLLEALCLYVMTCTAVDRSAPGQYSSTPVQHYTLALCCSATTIDIAGESEHPVTSNTSR